MHEHWSCAPFPVWGVVLAPRRLAGRAPAVVAPVRIVGVVACTRMIRQVPGAGPAHGLSICTQACREGHGFAGMRPRPLSGALLRLTGLCYGPLYDPFLPQGARLVAPAYTIVQRAVACHTPHCIWGQGAGVGLAKAESNSAYGSGSGGLGCCQPAPWRTAPWVLGICDGPGGGPAAVAACVLGAWDGPPAFVAGAPPLAPPP